MGMFWGLLRTRHLLFTCCSLVTFTEKSSRYAASLGSLDLLQLQKYKLSAVISTRSSVKPRLCLCSHPILTTALFTSCLISQGAPVLSSRARYLSIIKCVFLTISDTIIYYVHGQGHCSSICYHLHLFPQ